MAVLHVGHVPLIAGLPFFIVYGLARSEFIKKQYGKTNYQTFEEIKKIFDPNNILNPGKIISKKSTVIKNFEKL